MHGTVAKWLSLRQIEPDDVGIRLRAEEKYDSPSLLGTYYSEHDHFKLNRFLRESVSNFACLIPLLPWLQEKRFGKNAMA